MFAALKLINDSLDVIRQDSVAESNDVVTEDKDSIAHESLSRWKNLLYLQCRPAVFGGPQDATARPIDFASNCTFYISYADQHFDPNVSSFTSEDLEGNIDSIEIVPRCHSSTEYRSGLLQMIAELWQTHVECSQPNWDGYKALPISLAAVDNAIRFLHLLPEEIKLPEILPEPTGEIAFEWYRDKTHVLVISFSGNGSIGYAGIFGEGNKAYGREHFADAVPNTMIAFIHRVYE